MTPQSTFMIVAAVIPQREAELRRLLASMNDAPGRVNVNNALSAFTRSPMIGATTMKCDCGVICDPASRSPG